MHFEIKRDSKISDLCSQNELLHAVFARHLSAVKEQNPPLGKYLESAFSGLSMTSDKLLDVIRVGINSDLSDARIACLVSLSLICGVRDTKELRERFGPSVRGLMQTGDARVDTFARAAAVALQELSEGEILSQAFSDKDDVHSKLATLTLGFARIGSPRVRAAALISLLPSKEDSRDAAPVCQALAVLVTRQRDEIRDTLPDLAKKAEGMIGLQREEFQLQGISLLCILQVAIGHAPRIRELLLKSKSEKVQVAAAEYLVGYCNVEEAEYRAIFSRALEVGERAAKYQHLLALIPERLGDTVSGTLLRVPAESHPERLDSLFNVLVEGLTTAKECHLTLPKVLKDELQPALLRAVGRASGANREVEASLRAKAIEILKLARTL